jgi:hypothetical protein
MRLHLFYGIAIYIYIYIYCSAIKQYIYILFYVQPEDASKEPKHVAESCKFQNLIKVVFDYILLPYLING